MTSGGAKLSVEKIDTGDFPFGERSSGSQVEVTSQPPVLHE
ncbi:hypothetical protein [Halolactibacillus miurensis]|nr:hypothetical protein [Halolactibacillus miurensis]